MKLAKRMSERQLDEFEEFIDNHDDEGALRWLVRNFSDYMEVVQLEFQEIEAELGSIAEAHAESGD